MSNRETPHLLEVADGLSALGSREMLEETRLDLPLTRTTFGIDDWVVFRAEIGEAPIVMSDEHDRYRWVELDKALLRGLMSNGPRWCIRPNLVGIP